MSSTVLPVRSGSCSRGRISPGWDRPSVTIPLPRSIVWNQLTSRTRRRSSSGATGAGMCGDSLTMAPRSLVIPTDPADAPPGNGTFALATHRKVTTFALSLPTGTASYRDHMPTFEVTLRDHSIEVVDGADAYQQEGPMTTFFRRGDGRDVIDSWSTRVASFRTADLLAVRRHEAAALSLRAVAN